MERTEALSAEPPLKPNHPNQMKTVPMKTSVVLCGLPWSFSPLWTRFPRTKAYARAALHVLR
jgi:hypothetical protein